jgi:hypothetical protein
MMDSSEGMTNRTADGSVECQAAGVKAPLSHCTTPPFVRFWNCTGVARKQIPEGYVMRSKLIQMGLFTLVVAGAYAAVAEEATTAPVKAKVRHAPTANVDTNALLQQTVWKGELFAAPSNSAAVVVAVLKHEKHQKTGTYLLRTDDPILATRMRELGHAHKGSAVVLNARLDPDETNLWVTDILELPKERKPERK